jgi:UDP-N-acetylmuramyl-tripeptide synthetase
MRLVKKAIEKFSFVPGRLERINCRKGFSVFVDYAHTDDALKNILTALREIGPKRIITVFGCGGERDKLKRPKMGRIATSLSDFAIVTSDNPRSEDPRSIARDIIKGIGNKRFALQLDRAKAIRKAIAMARAGDIIVLAGKGHENYQIFKDRKIDFDDRKEAKECLRSLNY